MEFGPSSISSDPIASLGALTLYVVALHLCVAMVAVSRRSPAMVDGRAVPRVPPHLLRRLVGLLALFLAFCALVDELSLTSAFFYRADLSPASSLETSWLLTAGTPVALWATIALLMASRALLWPLAKTASGGSAGDPGNDENPSGRYPRR